MTTWPPAPASMRTHAAPRPELPPLTRKPLPAIRMFAASLSRFLVFGQALAEALDFGRQRVGSRLFFLRASLLLLQTRFLPFGALPFLLGPRLFHFGASPLLVGPRLLHFGASCFLVGPLI